MRTKPDCSGKQADKKIALQKDLRGNIHIFADQQRVQSLLGRPYGSNLDYEKSVTTNFPKNQRLRVGCREQGLTRTGLIPSKEG